MNTESLYIYVVKEKEIVEEWRQISLIQSYKQTRSWKIESWCPDRTSSIQESGQDNNNNNNHLWWMIQTMNNQTAEEITVFFLALVNDDKKAHHLQMTLLEHTTMDLLFWSVFWRTF